MKPTTGRRRLHIEQSLPDAANSVISTSDGITELMVKLFCSFRVVPLPLQVNTHLWPPHVYILIYLLAHLHPPNEDNKGQSVTQGLSWIIPRRT